MRRKKRKQKAKPKTGLKVRYLAGTVACSAFIAGAAAGAGCVGSASGPQLPRACVELQSLVQV